MLIGCIKKRYYTVKCIHIKAFTFRDLQVLKELKLTQPLQVSSTSNIQAAVATMNITDDESNINEDSSHIIQPIANLIQTDGNCYMGKPSNTRYVRSSGGYNRSYSKPNATKYLACRMNNYDIVKNINNVHTTKPHECPFHGPEFMPIKYNH